jgi:hypothetical protein
MNCTGLFSGIAHPLLSELRDIFLCGDGERLLSLEDILN